jgi:acyl-CoA synthetase (AMP-forming)/AMP-acid ligase II/1-acyl-sn-glycerol-3-phosphate acyltransferase/acyl carrier protein
MCPKRGLIMMNILVSLLQLILGLRYRIQVNGLDSIKKNDSRGILFIPNHPALIDPPIVFSSLFSRFRIRPLADENQVNIPIFRSLMKKIGCVTIPDMTLQGRHAKDGVMQAMTEVIDGLKGGDQFLFYPSGRVYRNQYESLRGNSGVAQILREVPDVRVVLVRTTGLWGSSFSRASGTKPSVFKDLGQKIWAVLSGFIFFMPKRDVAIELCEVDDLPGADDRLALNQYLEHFYNSNAPGNSHIPYFWWHGTHPQSRPEPIAHVNRGDVASISGETRSQIIEKISDLSGNSSFQDTDTLASDVGMDSLAVAELGVWVGQEFGHIVEDIEALNSVNDVFLAASGQLVSTRSDHDISAPQNWHQPEDSTLLLCADKACITGMFLAQALKNPSLPIMADLIGGVKRYRDILTGIFALVPVFKRMKETNIGLMLPAGVTCTIAYYSLLFAGKTPVMVNWTMGESNLNYCLEKVGVTQVVTAKALLTKLAVQGFKTEANPFSWLCLEDVGRDLSLREKLTAKVKSHTSISTLARARVQDVAAILFTSGSEARPKAVPLTHHNFIANVADVNNILGIRRDDVLVGMLPPFHSLGLTGTVILPMSLGMQVVYHANPTEAATLAKLIEEYKVTVLLGTPTFLSTILRSAEMDQLSSLRLAFTGAEKCPAHLYKAMAKRYPNTTLCEGYGVTECAPLISVNHPENPVAESIGKVLDSMEYVLVAPEAKDVAVAVGHTGMLLVRGKNVFTGYLHHEGNQPFINFADKQWYETGDLVREDEQGVLHFAGRLKRFIKLGGEMISLPAIESVLLGNLQFPEQDGVALAVEATSNDEAPELVLFMVFDTDRHHVNQAIREGGLSPLHNIRRVILVDEIPVLGTGKTDYQSLKKMI